MDSGAVVARNLNKTRKWCECRVSCKAERLRKDRKDAILLTHAEDRDEDTLQFGPLRADFGSARLCFCPPALPGQCPWLGAAKRPTTNEGSGRPGSGHQIRCPQHWTGAEPAR